MNTDAKVGEHYTLGSLEAAILQALERSGKDLAHLAALDLAAVDEFHVGGLEATQELVRQMELGSGMRLLDVGSGIGGPARYLASEHGCRVTGIDLTEEFVQVATTLTRLVGLAQQVDFRQGSALALPFEPGTFDRATMLHVGMNIADKAGVFREVRRALKPGGLFALFDIMRAGEGPIQYPVPWASSEETSFVGDVKSYRDGLQAAGFQVVQERDRREFAIAITERMMARLAQGGPPTLGLHLLMGDRTPAMAGNVLAMMRDGVVAPVELIARG